jgi:hypothetical protein
MKPPFMLIMATSKGKSTAKPAKNLATDKQAVFAHGSIALVQVTQNE